jgi:phosphoglycolate phosphatase
MSKYCVFDFDGTIADSGIYVLELLNDLSVKYDFKQIRNDDLNNLLRLSIKERCEFLNISLYKLPFLILDLKKQYIKNINSLKIFEKMHEVINKLKEMDINLIILSSNSKENIKKILINNNLDVFNEIYSSSSLYGKNKIIDKLINNNDIDKNDIIYIGDEERDIIACKKNNIKIIAVTWGYDSFYLLNKNNPDYIINKPDEIVKIVSSIFKNKSS